MFLKKTLSPSPPPSSSHRNPKFFFTSRLSPSHVLSPLPFSVKNRGLNHKKENEEKKNPQNTKITKSSTQKH
jgi:hypothetical protein